MHAGKLKFIADKIVYLLNVPNINALELPGFDVRDIIAGKASVKQVLLFAGEKRQLDKSFPRIAERLTDDAIFWIAYPKKSGSLRSDLTETMVGMWCLQQVMSR